MSKESEREQELKELEALAKAVKKPEGDPKSNIINVRVDEFTFRKVLAISHTYSKGTMSDVVRLCIEAEIDQIAEIYKKLGKAEREAMSR